MKPPPSLALIVNTYDQPDYLARVLTAVAAQTALPREVVLADDGSGDDTRRLFRDWGAPLPCRTVHAWQEHAGFRRTHILNQAIASAQSDYLVFLDGDSVPHPEFVADHVRLAQPGAFVQGHRALIEQRAAAFFGRGPFNADRRRALWQGQLRGLKHAYRWPRPLRRRRTDLRGVRGCNLAIWRADLVEVNGYNQAFTGWGREDSELCVRLMNLGRHRMDVRGWALCYHLWHPPASRAGLAQNDGLLEEAQRTGCRRCPEGLDRHQPRALGVCRSSAS
jgi:glycosyltransferase involved in cell wall biosynthesis